MAQSNAEKQLILLRELSKTQAQIDRTNAARTNTIIKVCGAASVGLLAIAKVLMGQAQVTLVDRPHVSGQEARPAR